MNILILEDEALIAESLYKLLRKMEYSPLEPVFTSEEAIAQLAAAGTRPDLAILDMRLEYGRCGLEVARYMIQHRLGIPFIILSAHSDRDSIMEAKALQPAAYLLKPFREDDLFAAIEMARPAAAVNAGEGPAAEVPYNELYLKIGNKRERIDFTQILFLQSQGKYTELFFICGKRRLIRTSLSAFVEQHGSVRWLRVHKSYAVNPAHITAVKGDQLQLGSQLIAVGRNFQAGVDSYLYRMRNA